eukprot:TRINITY_DN90611_c0_g1_i1.p1 TRINITY_DN90611_c0_g1~~TRINITY_DN90611_c0_g1_i1.p1  ORF type:complete len:725 (+),score=131.36 TRINITY_DN90611_c0_g1_i1:315-2177(+)
MSLSFMGPHPCSPVRQRPLRMSRHPAVISSDSFPWHPEGLSRDDVAGEELICNGAGMKIPHLAGTESCNRESPPQRDSGEAPPHDIGMRFTTSSARALNGSESFSSKAPTAKIALNSLRSQHAGTKKLTHRRNISVRMAIADGDNSMIKGLAGCPGLGFIAALMCYRFTAWYNDLQEPPRTGRLAKVVTSSIFQASCMFVILVNAVTSAYSADWSARHRVFYLTLELRIVETSFLSFYILELALKLMVHRLYFFCGQDLGWNLFDLMLVFISSFEELVYADDSRSIMFLRSVRVMKITRIFRILRVVKALQELKLMLYSILGSLRQLFWCIVLILFLLLIFGLFFLQELNTYVIEHLHDLPEEESQRLDRYFGSLPNSMTTLFMATTGGADWEAFYSVIRVVGWSGEMMFLLYIAFFNIAVINVLTGLFVEQAIKLSKMDREELVREQRMKELGDAKHLRMLCQEMDVDGSGTISWEELSMKLKDEKVLTYLAAIGLDLHDCDVFFQMLCSVSGHNEVDIDVFVRGCMRMKGGATGIDMQAMAYELKLIRQSQADLADYLDSICSMSASNLASMPKSEGECIPRRLNKAEDVARDGSHERQKEEPDALGVQQDERSKLKL